VKRGKEKSFLMTVRSVDGQTDQGTTNECVLLTVSEVAHQLRVGDTTVRRWVREGMLAAVAEPSIR
jgi:transposase-like protein